MSRRRMRGGRAAYPGRARGLDAALVALLSPSPLPGHAPTVLHAAGHGMPGGTMEYPLFAGELFERLDHVVGGRVEGRLFGRVVGRGGGGDGGDQHRRVVEAPEAVFRDPGVDVAA